MANRFDRIESILRREFAPAVLEIEDESGKHAGHAARNGLADGQTHYRVKMVSSALAGMSRLARSRAVHQALDAEFKTGLHALALSLHAPEDAI